MKLTQAYIDIAINKAGNRCERCKAQNHAFGWRDRHGNFNAEYGDELHYKISVGYKIRRIRLRVLPIGNCGLNCNVFCGYCERKFNEEQAERARIPSRQMMLIK